MATEPSSMPVKAPRPRSPTTTRDAPCERLISACAPEAMMTSPMTSTVGAALRARATASATMRSACWCSSLSGGRSGEGSAMTAR